MIDPISGLEQDDPLATRPLLPVKEEPQVEPRDAQGLIQQEFIAPRIQRAREQMPEPVPSEREVMQFARTGSDVAERRGYSPVKQDGAMVEFGQRLAGGFVESMRMMASTGEEFGIVPRGVVGSIEDWQEVNQHLNRFESNKAWWKSWSGIVGEAGGVAGFAIPTIFVGAVAGKLGAAAGIASRGVQLITKTGVGATVFSQSAGDDIKFFRDDVGLNPTRAILYGMMSATAKTIPDVLLGVEPKVADMITRGMVLNTRKAELLRDSLMKSVDKTAHEAIMARITGNWRPYFNTLKRSGIDTGQEAATELFQLGVDDYNRVMFKGEEFSSFSEYFDTGLSVIPGTLLLGGFASYRHYRNEAIINDMKNGITAKERNAAYQKYGQEQMGKFLDEIDRLKDEFLVVTKATVGGRVAEDQARAAADMIGQFALKAALKIDRTDGKNVNPMAFVERFKARLAKRGITAEEVAALRKVESNEQFVNTLVDWGIMDDVDAVRKDSDAEDNMHMAREMKKEMQVILNPENIERRAGVVEAALRRRGMVVQEVSPDINAELEAAAKEKPAIKDRLEAAANARKKPYDPILDASKKAKDAVRGKIYTGPISIEEARKEGEAILIKKPSEVSAEDMEVSLSRPTTMKINGQLYVEQLAENGSIVMVPAIEGIDKDGKRTVSLLRSPAQKKMISVVIPADPLTMGERQQQALFGAIGARDLNLMDRAERERMLSTLDAIAKRESGTPSEGAERGALEQRALEAVKNFAKRNNIAIEERAVTPESDTLENALFRLRVGIDQEVELTRQRNEKTPQVDEAQEASVRNAESVLDAIDAAMRRRGLDFTKKVKENESRPQFMSVADPAKMEAADTKAGLYLPSARVALFFNNEGFTPATFLHEYFHHVQAIGLMPTALQRALDSSFKSFPQDDRPEKEAEAFTRYLLDGTLPAGANPELRTAFEYVRSQSAAVYEKAKLNWQMPKAVQEELDSLFAGASYDWVKDAEAEAVLKAIENDAAANFMSVRRDPTKRNFHLTKRFLMDRNGMTEEQVRQMLIDGGMKGYLLAKDDPTRRQTSDMTEDEIAEAMAYMNERNTGVSPEVTAEQEAESNRLFGDEETRARAMGIADSLNRQPGADMNYGDAFGAYEKTKRFLGAIKRGIRSINSKFTQYFNIAKLADGMNENGPVTQQIRRLQTADNIASKVRHEALEEMRKAWAARSLAISPRELYKRVDLDSEMAVEAEKIATVYYIYRSGYADVLTLRNPEWTDARIKTAVRWFISDEGKYVREWMEGNKAAMQFLWSRLNTTALAVTGREIGKVNEWYIPMMSEEAFRQEKEWTDLVDTISPTRAEPGAQGARQVSQLKTRSDWMGFSDPDLRARMLNKVGKIDLRASNLVQRYVDSSATYVGKAPTVKNLLQIFTNPAVEDAWRRRDGDVIYHDALVRNIRSELYPGGRETQLTTWERGLQYVRSSTTIAGLGYNIRFYVTQPLALLNGWAAYATRPRDYVKSASLFMQGMAYGKGKQKIGKLWSREQFAGWEPYEQMIKDHPSLRDRTFAPDYRDFVRGELPFANNKFVRHAFDGAQLLDMASVVAIYTTAKQSHYDTLESKVISGQMSQAEAMKQSADFAIDVINKTQNPSGITQRTLGQKENEWVKMFNPFSGTKIVLYNYYLYDMVLPMIGDVQQAFREGGLLKATPAAVKTLWNHKRQLVLGVALPAVLWSSLYRLRFPEDEEELMTDLLAYPFQTLPVIGNAVAAKVTGKFETYAYDPTMIGAVARSVSKTFDIALKGAGFKGGWEAIDWKDARDIQRTFGFAAGIPDLPAKVALNFAEEVFGSGTAEEKEFLEVMGYKREPSKKE